MLSNDTTMLTCNVLEQLVVSGCDTKTHHLTQLNQPGMVVTREGDRHNSLSEVYTGVEVTYTGNNFPLQ